MAIARYHQCPACKRLMPSIQSRCDCGERFTGREPSFKGCPACGSLVGAGALWCDCGYLFIFRRFLDKQNVQEITPAQLDVAYERGRRDGAAEEKAKNDVEWDEFFKDAQLKNTVSGGRIRSRKDFQKWKKEYAAAKAALERRRKERYHFSMDTPDGEGMSVSGGELDAFRRMQKGGQQ